MPLREGVIVKGSARSPRGDPEGVSLMPVKGVEDVLPAPELLAHYKARIDEFEREREAMLAAVERCAVQQEEAHRLEWETRKRQEEVRELQQALSDAQSFLYEERQRLLALQAENDELKLQEIEDRKRIQRLLTLAQPIEQEVGYTADGLPSSMTMYPVRGASTAAAAGGDGPVPAGNGAAAAAAPNGERVLRTVFLPGPDTDALRLKLEALRAQLAEQTQLGEERVAALLADRRLREQDEARHRAAFNAQIEALSSKVRRLEETLRASTRDCILARQAKGDAEARAAAATAQMAADVAAAADEAAGARRAARVEAERARDTADGRMREYVGRFREQVRAREEELSSLASVHAATKAAAEKRIAELEARVTKLLEANHSLERRRQQDCEGWQADVTLLRKSLAGVDRKLLQMRLIDRLDDDERLDALLEQLEVRMPSMRLASQPEQQRHHARQQRGVDTQRRPSGNGGDDSETVSDVSVKSALAGELRAVRDRLDQMERRVHAKRKALKAGTACLTERRGC